MWSFKTGQWFLLLLFISGLSLSMISLHYAEAVENDGLVICEVVDRDSSSCEHRENNDNDHETVYAPLYFDLQKKLHLFSPLFNRLAIPLPDYKNSYHFLYFYQLNKPPCILS
jgi:hypothetical protein